MQTFLPYQDFAASAKVLDRARLGKQRVESMQIMNACTGVGRGWVNHPATRMWRGHEHALLLYTDAMIDEWTSRGYKDTCKVKIHSIYTEAVHNGRLMPNLAMPTWLGDPAFHASHRSNLLRKDSIYYGKFGWTESSTLPYIWPV